MKTVQIYLMKSLCVFALWLGLLCGYSVAAQNVMTNLINRPILACGSRHGLIVKADGSVWTWIPGIYEDYGQAGSTEKHLSARYDLSLDNNMYTGVPCRETNLLGAVAVAAGDYFSLVLKWDGSLYAFGNNDYGQLAIAGIDKTNRPTRVGNLSPVTTMSAGKDFAMAVLTNGLVKAWGRNQQGQLGISNTVSSITVPSAVVGLSNIVMVACGWQHALALSADGQVWAWGDNQYGQLGNGTTTDRSYPALVTNLSGVISIAAGDGCSMAVLTNGSVKGWGWASNHRLGLGNNPPTNVKIPTNIVGLSNICQITLGCDQGYALDRSGNLYGWGGDSKGMDFLDSSTPILARSYDTNFLNIRLLGSFGPKHDEVNYFYASAIDTNGMVRVWGKFMGSWSGYAFRDSFSQFDWGYGSLPNGGKVAAGAYTRGPTDQADFASFVLPLDLQEGVRLSEIGGLATNKLPFVTNYPVGYQYNSTNSAASGQTNLTLRIRFQNPIAAFGARCGGSQLYTGQSKRFAVFSGCPTMTNDYPMLNNYENALVLEIYSKTDFTLVGTTNIPIPFYLATNVDWNTYMTSGLTTTLNAFGLETTVSSLSYPNAYGVTNNGALLLTHQASEAATNFVYVIKMKGMNGSGWMTLDQNLNPAWQPLYTLEYQAELPWNIRFLSGQHFSGEPLPPFYDGKSLDELLTNSWVVTNTISLAYPIASYTNVDNSPELRSHPILDDFVRQLKYDPMAIARYVQNEIELTDAMDYLNDNQIKSSQIKLAGVSRGALGTFLERQGSPVEQCALLVYLLRKAGVPAVYAMPPTNGLKMLDTRLSKLLRVQLAGAFQSTDTTSGGHSLATVNYPWVAAYVDNQWVHLFPWLKDTEIIEGPNLYDYMPADCDNAMKWVMKYLYNDVSVVGLGDTNDPPEILFPRYVQKQLLASAPGISFDELGIRAVNRPHAYESWEEFPAPTWVATTNKTLLSLSDYMANESLYRDWNTNLFSAGTNIFNSLTVTVVQGTNTLLDSGMMRVCDVHNRPFLIFSERTNSAASAKIGLKMTLAAYRSSVTNVYAFTNDSTLLGNQMQRYVLPKTNYAGLTLKVGMDLRRPSGIAKAFAKDLPIKVGDMNALCLNFGRVSEQMLEPLAQIIRNMEFQMKQTPAITNSMTVDQYQGPLAYLMGMSYYQKVDRFLPVNARIHGRSPVSNIGMGLAKLMAKTKSGNDYDLPGGDMIYNQPSVDMVYNQLVMAEAPTAHPESSIKVNPANDSFNILNIVDGSAKEHVIINKFFNQIDSVSTVKLLQLAEQRHVTNPTNNFGIVLVNQNNVMNVQTNFVYGTWSFTFPPVTYYGDDLHFPDESIWQKVESAVLSSLDSQALMTPGNITNSTGSYYGTGALIIDQMNAAYSALISQAGNGGWGEYIPDTSFAWANLGNVWLGSAGGGDYSISFTPPGINFHPIASDVFTPLQTRNIFDWASSGDLQYTLFNSQWAMQTAGYLGNTAPSLPFNSFFADDIMNSKSRGFLGWLSDGLSQTMSAISDPVHVVSGEFFIDTVDLNLVGPLPLQIRRNYSSLNLADNEFGYGWKLSFTPYISIATNGTVMYVAEPDGSVLAYTPTPGNPNLWLPTLNQNPQMVNNRNEGIGSVANPLLTKIVVTNQSGTTNYYLNSPNGDVRNYRVMSFSISNVVDMTRPYLVSWTDARGNALKFSYGTNVQVANYGEVSRVDSGSGAYIQFSYDSYGHILRALANDGREVEYHYDDYGDLVRVTLPDASEINYEYSHGYQPVTNSFTANGKKYTNIINQVYSYHLLTTKTDPDGRILKNDYDTQRRVAWQAATAATDGSLVTNATFTYNNNFVLTNSATNTISGHTLLTDVFGKITRYDYTNSRITLITDPLNQTIQQVWYDENTNQPGYYPRSLWKTKDKRGLWTAFQYDNNGNITNAVLSGNLTGTGGTQTATNITFYNSNNLPVVFIDALGNSNVIRYDATFTYSPVELVVHRQGQAVTTNFIAYGNATNVVTYGITTWTNTSFGLPQMVVRAYGSADAASNSWAYKGSGFATNETYYTSTTDPNITNSLFYNGRGELYRKVDAIGRRHDYERDGMGRVISEEAFEVGQTLPMFWQNYYYNHNGDITWSDGPQYNPEDYIWYDYDGAGRRVAEVHWRSQASANGSGVEAAPTDSLYSITSTFYDAFGNLTQKIDPVGNYSLMAYDAIGQMTRQVSYSAANVPLATNLISYEAGGQVASITNSLGGVTTTLYTDTGKPYFRFNPDGSTNGWQYDLLGRVQKEFLPNGSYWQTTYKDAERSVVKQFYNAGGALLASTTNIFDRRGNLITNITARGAVFLTIYDGLDRVKVSGGPAANGGSAQQISYVYYDASGASVTNVDAANRKTVTTFDVTKRPVTSTIYDLAMGGTAVAIQTTTYSPDYHSTTVTSGTGGNAISRTTFVDSFGSPVLTKSYPEAGVTNTTVLTYDVAGRLVATKDELSQSTLLGYDGLSRVNSKTLPDGATILNAYNGEGSLTSMTMPGGLTWTATYNSAGQRTGERLVSGATVSRQFTNLFNVTGPMVGLLASTVDLGRSVTNSFVYDDYRRVATNAVAGPLAEQAVTTIYQYDAGGLVTNLTQASGINPTTAIKYSFDRYSQLTNEQVYIGGVLQNSFGQNWDAGGRRSALISPASEFDYGYQANDLLKSVYAFGSTYNFSFADNGLLASRSNPWRTLTVNSRDGQGRLTQQTTTVGSGNPLVETMTWRANSTLDSYAATRFGTGAWNESRSYAYNSRGQLTSEPVGLSNSVSTTYSYGFDPAKLGVLTNAVMSGALTNTWQATELSPLFQVTKEKWSGASKAITASGKAGNAGSVWATLDSLPVSSVVLSSGSWYADLLLTPGAHTLTANAYYPVGQFTNSATSSFTVNGNSSVTNYFDSTGYVTNRLFADGRAQTLTWDGLGRLLKVVQRDSAGNGFNWNAVYDALGRRLTTTNAPVTNGVIVSSQLTTINSFYDPQVEFQEVGVAVNGQRTWKVMGPDLNGSYGGLNGVGGLEATVQESGGTATPVLNDYFGNVLATVSGTSSSWTSLRAGSYGPVGYQSPTLSISTPLAQTLAWRSRRMDPSGLFNLGARYYDPIGRHFLSPDPLGHSSSMDLYSFANGDPVNGFDADGRFGKTPSEMAGNYNIGNTWWDQATRQLDDASYALSPAGQYMSAYHQTQADMARTLSWQPDQPTLGGTVSSLLNMTPVVGAFKMWWEGGFSGKDMVTGQWLNRSSAETIFGATANLAGSLGMMGGIMGEAAQGARFADGFAAWQMRSVQWEMQMAPRMFGATESGGTRVLFGQKRIGEFFSIATEKNPVPPYLSGRSISAVAADLRAGVLTADQLPINAFRGASGELITVNNRTLAALSEANLQPTRINMVTPTRYERLRLTETPIINSPLPGPSIPITESRTDLEVLRIISIP